MEPTIWPTEEDVSSELVLQNYRRLRTLNTLNLINRGIPGIKPPEIEG